jgi:translation initiation factor IF-2
MLHRSSCHHILAAQGRVRRRSWVDSQHHHAAHRSMSFKAFANRRNQTETGDDGAAADKVKEKKPPNNEGGGAFSNMIKRNADGSNQQSWRSRPAASFPSHNNDNNSNRNIWKSRPPNGSSENAPWQNSQQQHGRRSNNEISNNNFERSSNALNVRKQPSQLAGEDLKDITQLRDAFMKNTNQRQSWRTVNSSFSPTSSTAVSSDIHSPSSSVGSTWRPSFYRKKEAPTPNQGDAAAVNATSIEQVMKANSIQRKKDMEQRFLNAGETVPFNVDEFGNARNSNGPMNWRNRSQQQQTFQNNRNQNQYRNNNQHNQRHMQQRGQNRQSNFDRRRQHQQRQIRKHLPSSIPKTVRLPSTPQTLVDFSLLLRVNKRTIVRTLRALGESLSYNSANQDSFKIELETMELICIELGIEPTKVEKKMSVLEEAERRAMRQASGAPLDDEAKTEEEERYAALPPRSPVVSIMGHVDHGKTTLMDSLRRRAVTGANTPQGAGKVSKKDKKKGKKSDDASTGNVAGTEAGGITQVITAFEVPLPFEDVGDDSSKSPISTVTFLDTPGHAAFKKMRQSGSSATDVIVLVVAADDGVSPQTVEIINMYKAIARSQPQSISLVIAVSKIDKPGIDIDEAVTRIENQLMEHDIFTENVLAGGGDEGEFGACQLFPVSGITGEGLDDLIEGLALQSEMMDLRAADDAKGEGIVIDARMEKGLGVVADCVIRWGKVERGDFVVSGTTGGRVKFLNDVANNPLKKGRPSQPVRIVGFKSLPKAGDPIVCASSEDEAKEIIRLRESELINEERANFENDVELQVTGTAAKQGLMLQKTQQKYGFDDDEGEDVGTIRIPVVIKADSHGALEAVRDALVSIGTDSKLDVIIDPVEMSTGVVTTTDVRMARESDAAIFCFGKVGIADRETKNLAETEEVSIRNHLIIYRLLEDAKEIFSGYLPVEYTTKVHGKANVQAVFEVTDKKKSSVSVAGLRVLDGNLFKAKSSGEKPLPCFYRVMRNGDVVEGTDKLKSSSLRKVKEDVDSVKRGEECGLQLDGFNDLEEGDVIECYSIEEKKIAI